MTYEEARTFISNTIVIKSPGRACGKTLYIKDFNEAIGKALYALSIMPEYEKLKDRDTEKKPTQDLRKGTECYCPVCGNYVGWKDGNSIEITQFCSDCGQKLKWEDN